MSIDRFRGCCGGAAVAGWMLCALLASTAGAATLNLVGRVPLPGEPIGNRIVFFFDAPIEVPPAGDGTPGVPFTTEPALGGTFRVENNFIALTPAKAPDSGLIEVRFHEGLRSKSGAMLPAEARTQLLATQGLGPRRTRVLEQPGNRARIAFEASFPLDAASLAEHLAVLAPDGTPLDVALIRPEDGASFEAWVEGAVQWPLRVVFKQGLADASGRMTLPVDAETACPDLPPLVVQTATWGAFRPDRQEVLVTFSESVPADRLLPNLVLTELATGKVLAPRVEWEGNLQTHKVSFVLEKPEAGRVSVLVRPGIVSQTRTVLLAGFNTVLEREAAQFAVSNTWWLNDGRNGPVLVVNTTAPLREVAPPDTLKQYLGVSPAVENLRADYRDSDNEFVIKGDFLPRVDYTFTLAAGLPIDHFKTLDEPFEHTVRSEDPVPWAGFADEDRYFFPRRGGLALPLETRNIEQGELVVHRLFPNNLPAALEGMREGRPGYEFASRFSEELLRKPIEIAGGPGRLNITRLDLDALIPADKRGVFSIGFNRIEDEPDGGGAEYDEYGEYGGGRYWGDQAKLAVFSDLGVLAHWEDGELAVFVHGVFSLAPVPGAQVRVYSDKNQLLGETITNPQGVGMLRSFPAALGAPALVVVDTGTDYTFLALDARGDDASAMDAASDEYAGEKYEAFVYADRDLYRPGETAHLRWIVRHGSGAPLAGAPIDLQIERPNGTELIDTPVTLSALGTGGYDLATDRMYPTGTYTATLYVPGDKRVIGSYRFKIEDFVPNRMKAEIALSADRWLPGGKYGVTIDAQHLFGAPAADRKAQGWVIFQKNAKVFEGWPGYTFDNDASFAGHRVDFGEGRTDAEGKLVFDYECSLPPNATTPLRAYVFGEVFELGGRSVLGKTEATLLPAPVSLGIAADTDKGPRAVTVHIAAVAPDGAPAPLGEATVELERESWSYFVRRYFSNYESNWNVRYTAVDKKTVALAGGKGSIAFDVSEWGNYRLRVSSPATPQYSTLSFYSYGDSVNLADADRPRLVKLALDKERYQPGDTAQLRIEAPFDGQAIVLLQGPQLHTMIAVPVENKTAVAPLPIGADYYPNVWAEVTVIAKVEPGKEPLLPYSSFAMIGLPVGDAARELAVALEGLPESIAPAADCTFNIAVTDRLGMPAAGEITLAAVDEGIHGITSYRDPDPVRWFGRPRRATLRRAHYYDRVLFDFETLTPGGDLAAQLARRAVPPLKNWVKPVALWSGPVALDARGRAAVTLPVPEFSGQLRVVAVAAGERAVGTARGNVFVRRPHMLETSMPRFVLPGDTAQCRATLYNHTDQPCTAEVTWTASGALAAAQDTATLEVPAKGEGTTLAAVAAGAAMGQGALAWEAVFRDAAGAELQRLREQAALPVNPPAAYQSERTLYKIAPGESVEIANTGMASDALLQLDMTVAAHPAWRLKGALKDVLEYPYGCVEQTTSRCLPLLLLRQSEALMDAAAGDVKIAGSMLRAGIDRLFALQNPSGGLGYWPGYRDSYAYGSVYAFHFLTLARLDGSLPVPEAPYQALRNHVRTVVNPEDDGEANLFLRAYALYTLALAGEEGAALQVTRFDDVVMPAHARVLLAAIVAMQTGDRARAEDYLRSRPSERYDEIERGGTLNSPIRNLAFELIARMQFSTDIDRIHDDAARLMTYIETERGGSTQEKAFVITALASYLALTGRNIQDAAAAVEGPGGGAIAGPQVLRVRRDGPGAVYTVRNTGKTTVFADAAWKGTPLAPPTEAAAEGMRIERLVFDAGGAPYADHYFKQGENYILGFKLYSEQSIENVVVVDLLPAGLELLNPRLGDNALPAPLVGSGAQPNFLDVRDDRAVFAFDLLPGGEQTTYCLVQAVTPGVFTQPGLAAECMYDAKLRATTLPREVRVTE